MDWLMTDWLGTPAWFWMTFIALVTGLTAFDLGILNRRDREMGIRQSLMLSLFYIAIALAFGAWVWIEKGADLGLKYYTCLLYTSPSPRDKRQSRMPSSA